MAIKVNELNNEAQSTLTQLKRIIDDLKGCESDECLPVLHGLEVQLGELSNRSHVHGSAIIFKKITPSF